jgi:hypothetical protein
VSRFCSKLLTLEYNNCRGRFEIRPFPRRTRERCGRKQTASATNPQINNASTAAMHTPIPRWVKTSGNQRSLAYWRLLSLVPQGFESYFSLSFELSPETPLADTLSLSLERTGTPPQAASRPAITDSLRRKKAIYPPTTLPAGAARRTCSQFPWNAIAVRRLRDLPVQAAAVGAFQ